MARVSDTRRAETPFLDEELFGTTSADELDVRAKALAGQSAFGRALQDRLSGFAEGESDEAGDSESESDQWEAERERETAQWEKEPETPQWEAQGEPETAQWEAEPETAQWEAEEESNGGGVGEEWEDKEPWDAEKEPWDAEEEAESVSRTDHEGEEEAAPFSQGPDEESEEQNQSTGRGVDRDEVSAVVEETEMDGPSPARDEETLSDESGSDPEEHQLPQSQPKSLSLIFRSNAIPLYRDERGRNQPTDCAVYVPARLRTNQAINLLVFFHGDDACDPPHSFNPYKVLKNFGLDGQVDRGQVDMGLAVPIVYWKAGTSTNVSGMWTAARLNAFVEEVLDQIGGAGIRPRLNQLILAGHSHAYAILTPLAHEFAQGVADTTTGALAKLGEVWALDSTYGLGHIQALTKWAEKIPKAKFTVVLSQAGFDARRVNCREFKRGDPPIKYWTCSVDKAGAHVPSNLAPNVKKVSARHCEIPKTWVENLLFIQP